MLVVETIARIRGEHVKGKTIEILSSKTRLIGLIVSAKGLLAGRRR